MPGSGKEHFKRNDAFLLYNLYGHPPAQVALPRRHEIYILVDHSLYALSLSESYSEYKEDS